MLVSGLVHGVIYKMVWYLTLPEAAGLVAWCLVGFYLWMHQLRPSRGSTGTRRDRPDE